MTDARNWTYEHTATLTGATDQVFAALTDATQLRRWFAEYVEVDPRAGGPYRFWGKHTYGTPNASQAQQRIVSLDARRRLVYSWPFEGVDSIVTLDLTPDTKAAPEAKTTLRVSHAFSRRLDVPYSDQLVDDLWRLSLGNLSSHLQGGHGIVLPDFADPTPEVRLSIVIDAPRERVFRALTDPEAMNRWVAKAAVVELREGGRYEYGWKYAFAGKEVEGGPTTILALVPNERLVTDWPDWRGDQTRPPTRVTWLLEDAGAGTRLTLIHDGFSRVVDQSDYPFGWSEFLDRLKHDAEGRTVAALSAIAP